MGNAHATPTGARTECPFIFPASPAAEGTPERAQRAKAPAPPAVEAAPAASGRRRPRGGVRGSGNLTWGGAGEMMPPARGRAWTLIGCAQGRFVTSSAARLRHAA